MFGLTPYNRKNNGISRRDDFWDFRNVFEDFFGDSMFPEVFSVNRSIRADVRETEKEYIVDAEIPGVRKEDIRLDLRDDVLTISVVHNEEINEEREGYIRKERKSGSFCRSFYVENVKNEAVTAKYDNGILTITLPKEVESNRKSHKIDIQ